MGHVIKWELVVQRHVCGMKNGLLRAKTQDGSEYQDEREGNEREVKSTNEQKEFSFCFHLFFISLREKRSNSTKKKGIMM